MTRYARPIVIGVALLLAGVSCFAMYEKAEKQILWGNLPLFAFLMLWILVNALWSVRTTDGRERLWWSGLSGLLLGLGFPGWIPAPFLLFAGFVPLLMLEESVRKSNVPNPTKIVFAHSYNAFLLWNILSTYWVANTAFAAGIVAIALNSLFMAVVFTAYHKVSRIMPRLSGAIFLAFWIAFEYLHFNWEISWPWLALGHGFAQFPALVQWYEYTGIFGGALWILSGNLMVFSLWQSLKNREVWTWKVLRLSGWILIPIGFSLFLYYNYDSSGQSTAKVAIVQPNYEPHYEKFNLPEAEQMGRFLELSAQVVDSTTDYLLWPETSFGYVETRSMESYPAVVRLREFMQSYPQLKVIAGIDAFHIFLPGEAHSRAVRSSNRNGRMMYYEVLNAAAQFSGENAEVPIYRKSKLVPGPEILPYREVLGVFKPVIEQVQGTVSGVGTQKERTAFGSSSGLIAPVICYESVFGEFFTGYIGKGAQAAFIMTNDGWWDNTPGHRQHLWIGSLRAIETRRSIARAANTGITCFINQRGDILQPTRYNEAVAISGEIQLSDEVTAYVRWGDFIARIAVFTTMIFLLNAVAKTIQRKIGFSEKN